jgi:hypothetical protein
MKSHPPKSKGRAVIKSHNSRSPQYQSVQRAGAANRCVEIKEPFKLYKALIERRFSQKCRAEQRPVFMSAYDRPSLARCSSYTTDWPGTSGGCWK